MYGRCCGPVRRLVTDAHLASKNQIFDVICPAVWQFCVTVARITSERNLRTTNDRVPRYVTRSGCERREVIAAASNDHVQPRRSLLPVVRRRRMERNKNLSLPLSSKVCDMSHKPRAETATVALIEKTAESESRPQQQFRSQDAESN